MYLPPGDGCHSYRFFPASGKSRAITAAMTPPWVTRSASRPSKAEVRAVSLSKLSLTSDAVIYDVGAGTGSVSVECALGAYDGQVYAIERDADAAALIARNREKFGTENLQVVEGAAPEAFAGRLNPAVRIVLNAVTLETQAEAMECVRRFGFRYAETVCVNIARARRMGRYNLMAAQNPVYIVTMEGGTPDD